MFRNTVTIVAVAAILLTAIAGAAAPAAAAPHDNPEPTATPTNGEESGDDEEEEEDTNIINIDVSGIIDAITDLGSNLVDKITEAIFAPFEALAKAIIDVLTALFTTYPTVQPNDDVQELHRLALIVTFALSTLAVIITGLLFQIGPIFGISYQQARLILPRVLLALVFSTVSPYLLQYAVDFASALTQAFKPTDPSFLGSIQLTGGLVIVGFLDAFILAAVAAIFVVRNIYILFAAAASPLIALGWALPYTRRFAHSFISTFWAFLLIGPLDMIVFRLTLSLLEVEGGEVPHWLLAMGGFVMLLGVPYMLLTTGQAMAGSLAGMATNATATLRNHSSSDSSTAGQRRRRRRQEQALIRRNVETDSRRRRRNRSRRTRSEDSGSGVRMDNRFRDMLPEEIKND